MTHLDGSLLDALWDDFDAAAAEPRLREAQAAAQGTVADELTTQMARAAGLQGRYQQGHALLDTISNDDPVVQQRIALERGRLHNSAGDAFTARPFFQRAVEIDADTYLTVDALHMLAMVNPSNARYWYTWGMRLVTTSDDPRIQRWEGPLRNNWAWTLVENYLPEEALAEFFAAEEWFFANGTAHQVHVARWSIAHILRRTGRPEEARALLLDLKENSEPDSSVDDELALLDG